MPSAPIQLRPGELWLHFGFAPQEFFHAGVVQVPSGSELDVKLQAKFAGVPVVMTRKLPMVALNYMRRNNGVLDRIPSEDAEVYADVITTGYLGSKGLVVGCLKDRDGPLFAPFIYVPQTLDLWKHLLDEA